MKIIDNVFYTAHYVLEVLEQTPRLFVNCAI